MNELQRLCERAVASAWFSYGIMAIILVNAVLVGLETSDYIHQRFSVHFGYGYDVILAIFVVEALVKMTASYPRPHHYFRDGWNCFDFAIIVFCLIPATGQLAMVARLARLLRVMRIISVLPQLRILVTALMHSVPGMLNVVLLMSVIFYMYAVAGYHLFHEIDPTHWRTLGISMLSLFQIVTLEDWADIMYNALEHFWWAWAYFVSFVVIATFVIINLFIGIVVTNVQEARDAQLAQLQSQLPSAEMVAELKRTRKALKRVQERLEADAGKPGNPPRRE